MWDFWGNNIVYADDSETTENKAKKIAAKKIKAAKIAAAKIKEENWKTANKTQKAFVWIIMIILQLITYPITMLLNVVTWALHPSTVFDPAMMPTLKSFWLLLKNITMTVSVFVLIWLALKNLFSKWEWLTELWSKVWMLAVYLVLINFSWFAVKFIIDIWNISTRAAFTLYQDFWANVSFLNKWYKIYWAPVVNWVPNWQRTKTWAVVDKKFKNMKNDLCLIYVEKDSWKPLYEILNDTKKNNGPTEMPCMVLKKSNWEYIWEPDINSSQTTTNSKVILILEKIWCKNWKSCLWAPTYDLPSALIMNFIPMWEFYKISAWTQERWTLWVEALFSIILALICMISILWMLIILIQRLVFLWLFLVASPLYFFDKILNLLTWSSILPENLWLSELLKQAIFIPVWLWVLYVSIAVFWWELFYNNLLTASIASFTPDLWKANTWLWSFYQLVIWAWIIIWLWKWTEAIAKMSWSIAERTIDTSMKFMSWALWSYAKNSAMNAKLFTSWWSWEEDINKTSLADLLWRATDKIKSIWMTDQQKRQEWYQNLETTFTWAKWDAIEIKKTLEIKNNDKTSYNNKMDNIIKDDKDKKIRAEFVEYIKDKWSINEISTSNQAVINYTKMMKKHWMSKWMAVESMIKEIWVNWETWSLKDINQHEIRQLRMKLNWIDAAFVVWESDIKWITELPTTKMDAIGQLDTAFKSSKLSWKYKEFLKDLLDKWITAEDAKEKYWLEKKEIKITDKKLATIIKVISALKK